MRKYKGVAVIVTNKEEFDKVKSFLGSKPCYLDWHEVMGTKETGVILKAIKGSGFSKGGVGSAEYMRELRIKTVAFDDNLKQFKIN